MFCHVTRGVRQGCLMELSLFLAFRYCRCRCCPWSLFSAKLVGFVWIGCLPEGSPVFKIPYSVTGYLSHVLHGESTNSTVCPVRDRSLCPPCCATVQRGKPSSLNRYSHPVSPPRDAPCFSLHNCFLSKTTILWWSHVRSVARTSRL